MVVVVGGGGGGDKENKADIKGWNKRWRRTERRLKAAERDAECLGAVV